MKKTASALALGLLLTTSIAQAGNTKLYWGDTHLHTNYSPDAYVLGNKTADPDQAYRFAKGLPVIHPSTRTRVTLQTPLDFLVVSDHAEYMGVVKRLFEGDKVFEKSKVGKKYMKMVEEGKGKDVFFDFVESANTNKAIKDLNSNELKRDAWNDIVNAAEEHNNPGKFTSFIGWEWSSITDGANLHRVVFMPENGRVAKKFLPYSSFDSDKPENLWAWLDKTSKKTGANFIAIPHNSNVSKGKMFDAVDSNGRPITSAYARTRMKWEPVVEITQIKGDSETHPKLSPKDKFADFETYAHLLDGRKGADTRATFTKGDYVRSGLKRGLEIENKVGVNPYKFGVIGSTDAHTGMPTAEENNFWGKSAIDVTPEGRKEEVTPGSNGFYMSASGLAAVWAEENTRSSLASAFKRREVYGTTGPRIALRMFGGFDFVEGDEKAKDLAKKGYSKGVPMGGDLANAPKGKAPTFLIQAVKDPKCANLDRIQVVKGWLDTEGVAQEKVYDVALADGRKKNWMGRVRNVGNTVDTKTGKYTNTIGDPELATVWKDPKFNPSQRAFYYVRVLQIPTPRHSLLDALALEMDVKKTGRPATIQERAYSSPIWYTPTMKSAKM